MIVQRLGLIVAFIGLCGAAEPHPREPRYLGPGTEPGSARVQLERGHVIEIRPGEPSAIGALQSADDDEMVVDQPVSDEERDRFRAYGDVVPDVNRIHVHRHAPGDSLVSSDPVE